jgi:hypothetical protein
MGKKGGGGHMAKQLKHGYHCCQFTVLDGLFLLIRLFLVPSFNR